MLFVAYNAIAEWRAWVGLTYPSEFPKDGRVSKSHLNEVLIYSKRFCDVEHYLWAFEFQERGAPHFHVLFDHYVDKEWLSKTWYEIVGSGDMRHLHAGTSVKAVYSQVEGVGYLLKEYGAKKRQKVVPVGFENVGRFWGASRGLAVPQQSASFGIDLESVQLVRTLRRFMESQRVKVKRLRPISEHHSRKRCVRRKPTLSHLHTGLNGFTVYNGAKVGARLLDSLAQADDSAIPPIRDERGDQHEA